MEAPITLASLQNLGELFCPVYYDQEQPLPKVTPGLPTVPPGLTAQSFLSNDCLFGCLYNGPVLRCFPIKTHPHNDVLFGRMRIPVVINTMGYHFPAAIVKCVVELNTHGQKNGINMLLVGLDCGNDGGALVIFDPIRAEPMKWIRIPTPVTSLAVMTHFEKENCIHPFFNESLMAMVGIAAVGLLGGKVLMVDLGLDHLESHSTENSWNPRRSSMNRTWHLLNVQPHESAIARTRKDAAIDRKCICLDLGNQEFEESDKNYSSDLFYYIDKDGDLMGRYYKRDIFVSCLHYVPNIGSLIVGFSFGGLQIWRVDDHRLEYSIDMGLQEVPVHSIEFQQPVDDPKNFCYLWVLHGTKYAELQNSYAVLYALFYKKRTIGENSMVLYDNFQSCVPRLTFELQDFYAPDDLEVGSVPPVANPLVTPLRMWNQGDNLICFSWECSREGIYYLGMFDLNQWYSSQTPNRLDAYGQLQLNPFWTAISFQNPIDIRRNIIGKMWDVRIIPGTCMRWDNNFSKHEILLYPSALTYQCVCLASSGTYIFENFSIQEKLIRVIQNSGYQLMAEPSLLRSMCTRFGLDPVWIRGSGDKISDQYYIFTVLLENSRASLITLMANRWVDGSMANLGCTIELILSWMFEFTIAVRNIVNEHWINLLKFQTDVLPPDTSYFITYSNLVWNQIFGILRTLVRHDRVCEDEYRDSEITKMEFIFEKLVPYSSVLLMMHRAKILPVMDDCDVTAELKEICSERRRVVAKALKESKYLEPEYRLGHTLLIDYLLENFDEEFLRAEWGVEPGEELYPPKHPGSIFNMLIGNWVDIDRKIISRVIFYFMLDIMNLKGHETTLRGNFASIIQLTSEEQHEVVQIWNVDHGVFQDPLVFMAHHNTILDEPTGLPWAAAIVHTVIQGSETTVMEILRRKCPTKLGKLYLNLVTHIHKPYGMEKFMQIVSSPVFCRNQELLFHSFDNASSLNFLQGFIQVHSRRTPISVQQALISYLDKSPITFTNQHLLLTFFLCRKDYDRATEQFEKMKRIWPDRKNFTAEEAKNWRMSEAEIKLILNGSSRNRTMEFLGYAPQKSIPKPPTLVIKATKHIPTTPQPLFKEPAPAATKAMPLALQRILGIHGNMREGATPLSPLRRYSGKIKTPEPEPDPEPSPPVMKQEYSGGTRDSESPLRIPCRMNLEQILQSPRVEPRECVVGAMRKDWDVDEHNDSFKSCFASPCITPGRSSAELHSIMKKREAELGSCALRKRVLLKTRFEDLADDGSPSPEPAESVGASVDLDESKDESVQSGETSEKSEPGELEIEIQNLNESSEEGEDEEVEVEVEPIPSTTQATENVEEFQTALLHFVNKSSSLEEKEVESIPSTAQGQGTENLEEAEAEDEIEPESFASIAQPSEILEEPETVNQNQSIEEVVIDEVIPSVCEPPADLDTTSNSGEKIPSDDQMEICPDSDDSRHSGDITAPSTMKRMTRNLSRAKSVETDQSIDLDSDHSSVGTSTENQGRSKRKASTTRKRRKKTGAASITDLVATTTSKLRKGEARRRGVTPEIGSQENEDKEEEPNTTREIVPPRRITRSVSRAKSEASEDDASVCDSETSVLDSSMESTASQRKKRKVKGEKKQTESRGDGPSSRTRRKSKSEPRELDVNTSVINDSIVEVDDTPPVEPDDEFVGRRAIFGYAPALSTLIEESESSLPSQTPKSAKGGKGRSRIGSSMPKLLLRETSTSSSSLRNVSIPEELPEPVPESPKPGPSRKSAAAVESVDLQSSFETSPMQSGKRRRWRNAQPADLDSSSEIKIKRRKGGDDLKEKDVDSDASTQSVPAGRSVAKRGRGRPRKRAQSEGM